MNASESNQAQHLELILQQLDSLPTLPAVAVRLLQITDDEASDARQVIELVASDPALTGKVLTLCRKAEAGIRETVTTVDRAVTLLGFKAIRNAVLSIKVFEVFSKSDRQEAGRGREGKKTPESAEKTEGITFDHAGFWRHSLAVAIGAELIADAHRDQPEPVNPSEAFVAGLLHDVGKLALEHLLPRSYQRVVELAERGQRDIAEVERQVIGMDHFTVGKRLAEHWRLPHLLADVMWLHGSPRPTLPEVEHRGLIALVGIADAIVRNAHIGFSANYRIIEDLDAACAQAGLIPQRVRQVTEKIAGELERRSEIMGLGAAPSQKVLLEAVMSANSVLGRMNEQLAARKRESAGRQRVLEAVARFHALAGAGGNIQDAMSAVAESAASALGEGWWAIVYQAGDDAPWLLSRYGIDGRGGTGRFVDPPPKFPLLKTIEGQGLLLGVAPWMADQLGEQTSLKDLRVLALPGGADYDTIALLIHDRKALPAGAPLEALTATWGAAIAAATRHQGARRLGERLAQANRLIASQQDTLLRAQSMARLGEMAAGAAHEMNNPLAIISGRAQLLASRLADEKLRTDAAVIWQQCGRLSDLISSLRLLADPPQPRPARKAVRDILERAIHLAKQKMTDAPAARVSGMEIVPYLVTDADQLSTVISELLLNAYQAQPKNAVKVAASVDPLADRWIVTVADDGIGMEPATLEHAFDPFFSAKPAGRQTGMGLPRARRLIEGLGGSVELSSQKDKGTIATVSLPLKTATADQGIGASRRIREGDRREATLSI